MSLSVGCRLSLWTVDRRRAYGTLLSNVNKRAPLLLTFESRPRTMPHGPPENRISCREPSTCSSCRRLRSHPCTAGGSRFGSSRFRRTCCASIRGRSTRPSTASSSRDGSTGVGRVGEQPAGQILPPHPHRTPAAHGGTRELGTDDRRRHPHPPDTGALRRHCFTIMPASLKRVRTLFRRGAMERELDAELEFHLDMLAAEGTCARARRPTSPAAPPVSSSGASTASRTMFGMRG